MARSELLHVMRTEIRRRGYSYRTEKSYCSWIVRFVRFHSFTHPAELDDEHVVEYLNYLVSSRNVSSSTQNQALCAIVFLYRNVLKMELGELQNLKRAKKHQTLPVVLSTKYRFQQGFYIAGKPHQQVHWDRKFKCLTNRKIMFSFINDIGVFGMPLVIITLFILYLTVRYGLQLWSKSSTANPDIDNVIYLGIFALSLGIFSHFLGLYQASGIMGQLRAEQIAAGYGQSLIALLYGFRIFFLAAVCWFGLRLAARKREMQPVAD